MYKPYYGDLQPWTGLPKSIGSLIWVTGAAETSICMSEHEGQQQGLLPFACFLLLLDRQESQTLRKPVTSWTYIRTGRNQILPRLTRVSPPLLGPLQWGARWTWHEGGRAWSTCCWWLGSSCMWRYHYVDHVHTSSKKNWLHLRDYLNLSLQPWVQRWRQCYGM